MLVQNIKPVLVHAAHTLCDEHGEKIEHYGTGR